MTVAQKCTSKRVTEEERACVFERLWENCNVASDGEKKTAVVVLVNKLQLYDAKAMGMNKRLRKFKLD